MRISNDCNSLQLDSVSSRTVFTFIIDYDTITIISIIIFIFILIFMLILILIILLILLLLILILVDLSIPLSPITLSGNIFIGITIILCSSIMTAAGVSSCLVCIAAIKVIRTGLLDELRVNTLFLLPELYCQTFSHTTATIRCDVSQSHRTLPIGSSSSSGLVAGRGPRCRVLNI